MPAIATAGPTAPTSQVSTYSSDRVGVEIGDDGGDTGDIGSLALRDWVLFPCGSGGGELEGQLHVGSENDVAMTIWVSGSCGQNTRVTAMVRNLNTGEQSTRTATSQLGTAEVDVARPWFIDRAQHCGRPDGGEWSCEWTDRNP
jgi:hypothetical protein